MRTAMLRNRQLTGGLTMFFFQYLVQAGFFFVVPLFLSVALGLSAIDTGVRLLPLSVTLLAAAIGIPRFLPHLSPRLVVRVGLLSLLAGTVVLLGALDADAGPEVVFVPMLLVGLGIGALASQLGAVTVSAVPDDESPEVGGVQNTMTNLGASLGTALAGSLLIASLTSAFLTNIAAEPRDPGEREGAGAGRARRRRRRSSRTPTSRPRSTKRASTLGRDRGGARGLRRRPPRRPALRSRDPRRARPRRAVPGPGDPDETGRCRRERGVAMSAGARKATPRTISPAIARSATRRDGIPSVGCGQPPLAAAVGVHHVDVAATGVLAGVDNPAAVGGPVEAVRVVAVGRVARQPPLAAAAGADSEDAAAVGVAEQPAAVGRPGELGLDPAVPRQQPLAAPVGIDDEDRVVLGPCAGVGDSLAVGRPLRHEVGVVRQLAFVGSVAGDQPEPASPAAPARPSATLVPETADELIAASSATTAARPVRVTEPAAS